MTKSAASRAARVVGVGQPAAGDDGVGLAVLAALRDMGPPRGTELLQAPDGAALVPILETSQPVMILDAVVGAAPGQVMALSPEELEAVARWPVSTHGLGVPEAIALARLLYGARCATVITILGVGIAPPAALRVGLSPEVAASVPQAAARALALLRSMPHP